MQLKVGRKTKSWDVLRFCVGDFSRVELRCDGLRHIFLGWMQTLRGIRRGEARNYGYMPSLQGKLGWRYEYPETFVSDRNGSVKPKYVLVIPELLNNSVKAQMEVSGSRRIATWIKISGATLQLRLSKLEYSPYIVRRTVRPYFTICLLPQRLRR